MSNNNHFRNLPVPFFSQRQNDYILEEYFTSDIKQGSNIIHKKGELKRKISMDHRTCNITSVMMVMKYLGLTGIERTVNDTNFTTPSTPKEFLTKYFNHEYDFAFGKDKRNGTSE